MNDPANYDKVPAMNLSRMEGIYQAEGTIFPSAVGWHYTTEPIFSEILTMNTP